jgi:hypothetical protein
MGHVCQTHRFGSLKSKALEFESFLANPSGWSLVAYFRRIWDYVFRIFPKYPLVI